MIKLISGQNKLISEQNNRYWGTRKDSAQFQILRLLSSYKCTIDLSISGNRVSFTSLFHTLTFSPKIHFRRQLIESLKISRDIDKTLLVFSHDVWDVEINRLVRWSKSAKWQKSDWWSKIYWWTNIHENISLKKYTQGKKSSRRYYWWRMLTLVAYN